MKIGVEQRRNDIERRNRNCWQNKPLSANLSTRDKLTWDRIHGSAVRDQGVTA